MKKFRTAVFLALILVLGSALPVSAYDAVSRPDYYEEYFVDQVRSKNARTQAITEYVYATYGSNDQFFKGKGECYGYAEMIRQMYGTGYKQKNYGVKATAANMYKYLKKLKPGTHVRFAKGRNGSGRAHSIVLLKINRTTMWYTDGNVGPYNAVRVDVRPLSSFAYSAQSNGYSNLVWSREPKGSVPTVSKPSLKVSADRNGPETHIAWRPVNKAKSYIVYRSASKNSAYRKIATVKNTLYIDRSTDLYGNAYYKVRAVVSKKKSLTSKPVLAKRKVKAPRAYLTVKGDEDEEDLTYELTWSPVHGADKYNIYLYDMSKNKYVKHTVNGTSWVLPKTDSSFLELYINAEGKRKNSASMYENLYY